MEVENAQLFLIKLCIKNNEMLVIDCYYKEMFTIIENFYYTFMLSFFLLYGATLNLTLCPSIHFFIIYTVYFQSTPSNFNNLTATNS